MRYDAVASSMSIGLADSDNTAVVSVNATMTKPRNFAVKWVEFRVQRSEIPNRRQVAIHTAYRSPPLHTQGLF
jgi:hypothetical protein